MPTIVTIAAIPEASLPKPLPQPSDTFVASFLITNNPGSVTAYQAAVGVAGSVSTSFTSGTTFDLAVLSGTTWTNVATFVVGANGTIVENIASLTLPGLLAPGSYLLYEPGTGTTTSVSNLGVVLLADDGQTMGDGADGIQVIQLYDKSGNLLANPSVSYLDYTSASDLDGLALTPDGSQGIMVDGGNTVRFFSGTQTGTTKASTTTVNIGAYGGDGDSVAILPNGDEAVVSGDDPRLNLLVSGILSGKPVAAQTIPVPSKRDGLVISADGKVLLARGGSGLTVYAIASMTPKPGSIAGTVSHSFTETADLPALGSYDSEDGRDGMSSSPIDSSRAVVVNPASGTIELLTGLPGKPVVGATVPLGATPYAVSITPNGKMAAVGTATGMVLVSGVDTGNLAVVGGVYAPTYTAGGASHTLGFVSTLNITLDNKYVVAGDLYNRALVVVPFTAAGFANAPAAALANIAVPYNDQLAIH